MDAIPWCGVVVPATYDLSPVVIARHLVLVGDVYAVARDYGMGLDLASAFTHECHQLDRRQRPPGWFRGRWAEG